MNPTQPPHYKAGKYDVIWFCDYHNVGFAPGNVIKYVFRAGHKDPTKYIEDLDKAIEYINRMKEAYYEHNRISENNA